MNNRPVYWTMRNGEQISVDDMDINHLRNTLKMIIRNSQRVQQPKPGFKLNGDMAEEFNVSFPPAPGEEDLDLDGCY